MPAISRPPWPYGTTAAPAPVSSSTPPPSRKPAPTPPNPTLMAHKALKAHTSTQRAHRALKAHTSTPGLDFGPVWKLTDSFKVQQVSYHRIQTDRSPDGRG